MGYIQSDAQKQKKIKGKGPWVPEEYSMDAQEQKCHVQKLLYQIALGHIVARVDGRS